MTPEFKRGARAAWETIREGEDLEDMIRPAESTLEPDDFTRGWLQQCRNPETELCPPEPTEVPDYSFQRGLLIGLGITVLVASVFHMILFGPVASIGVVAGLAFFLRASRLPA